MKLAIVIVNWNTQEYLRKCLVSLFLGRPECEFEIWLVDNASGDGSTAMVRQQFPQVHLIANGENVGFAQANNQAILQSTGRYVLLLNPDTDVRPGAIDALVEFMDRNPHAGAAGPRLLNPDGTFQTSCQPAPSLFREFWRLFHLDALHPYSIYSMQDWELDEARDVDVLEGACLILRREALSQVGLIDEDFFMYSEEVDLCHRLRTTGWMLYWIPHAQVMHYGGRSTAQVPFDMFLRLYQSKVLYFRKNHRFWSAQLYKLILVSAVLARLVASPLVWLERQPQRQRYMALASYYRRLLIAVPRW